MSECLTICVWGLLFWMCLIQMEQKESSLKMLSDLKILLVNSYNKSWEFPLLFCVFKNKLIYWLLLLFLHWFYINVFSNSHFGQQNLKQMSKRHLTKFVWIPNYLIRPEVMKIYFNRCWDNYFIIMRLYSLLFIGSLIM